MSNINDNAGRKPVSKRIRFEVFKRDSFKCQYCGKSAPESVLHVDHIDPVANGGDSDITNLITSCEACNLGKGARLLSESTAVQKSKAQMDELQERREQLEMMMAWRNGLKDIKQDAVEQVKLYWEDLAVNFSLNETGQQSLRKNIKQFSVDEVIQAMDEASDAYFEFDQHGHLTAESVNKAYNAIGGICRVARVSKEKPYIKDLYYSRGILRKRINYCDSVKALEWMEAAVSWGVTVAEIRDAVLSVRSWTEFSSRIDSLIKQAKDEGR